MTISCRLGAMSCFTSNLLLQKVDWKLFWAEVNVADLKWCHHSIPWSELPISGLLTFLPITYHQKVIQFSRFGWNSQFWEIITPKFFGTLMAPKRHVLGADCVIWAISHQNRFVGLVFGSFEGTEKSQNRIFRVHEEQPLVDRSWPYSACWEMLPR